MVGLFGNLGFYLDGGKEHRNYYSILGSYMDSGK